jgi:hypothetical protein
MSKIYKMDYDKYFGQYYCQRQFAWIPVYINGGLGWLRHYWDMWYVDDKGVRHDCSSYWQDPREG